MSDGDGISPREFRAHREAAANNAEDLGVEDLANQVLVAIENDEPRTAQGAVALGYAGELAERLRGDP